MAKLTLICLMLVILTGCMTTDYFKADSHCFYVAISSDLADVFSDVDVGFLDFSLQSTKAELVRVMGEPNRHEGVYAGVIGDYIHRFYYDDFGIVSLLPTVKNTNGTWIYTVFSIEITSVNYACSRGIRVGDCYRQVIARFLVESNPPDYGYAYMQHYLYEAPCSNFTGRLIFDSDGLPSAIVYEHTLLRDDGEFSGIGYALLYRIENNIVASIRLSQLWLH